MPKYKNWCFTWFTYDSTPGTNSEWWLRFEDKLEYGILQLERCPSTERLHLQGYLEFKDQVTAHAMQKFLPGSEHSRRLGTDTQAREYCRKEDTREDGPWEYGVFKEASPGKRNDLLDVKRLLDEGADDLKIAEEHFGTFLRYHRGIREFRRLKSSKRTKRTEWEVHIGEPGTGKTTTVQEVYPEAYWKNATQWWDGYAGHKTVVLDEFVGWLPYHELMRLGDSTELLVNVKGSFTQFVAEKVVLISNKMPWDWYHYDEKKLDRFSLYRRIDWMYFHKKERRDDPLIFSTWDEFSVYALDNGMI